MTPAGFPHSEISGSLVVCTSPELIAAYRVLHRLLAPRHPPCALRSLAENPIEHTLLRRSALDTRRRRPSSPPYLSFSCQRAFVRRPEPAGDRSSSSDALVETAGIEPATSGL